MANSIELSQDLHNFLSNESIHQSGILGDESLKLLSNVILIVVGLATFIMIFLKVFLMNNSPRFSEEEFRGILQRRTNIIPDQNSSNVNKQNPFNKTKIDDAPLESNINNMQNNEHLEEEEKQKQEIFISLAQKEEEDNNPNTSGSFKNNNKKAFIDIIPNEISSNTQNNNKSEGNQLLKKSTGTNEQTLENNEFVSVPLDPVSNSSAKMVEEGFREALRKVDTKNDKMIELMNLNNKTIEDYKNSNSHNISLGRDFVNYTEMNRSEYLSNSRTEFDNAESEYSNNIRTINKKFNSPLKGTNTEINEEPDNKQTQKSIENVAARKPSNPNTILKRLQKKNA